jgi:uncharacterized integral membrane protein
MNNVWDKIKLWTKITICTIVSVYLLVFIIKNMGPDVTFWYWYNRQIQASMLFLIACAFIAGVIMTVLARMMFRTARQISVMRNSARTEKLEREVADMKAKAAMLQTKAAPGATVISTSDQVPLS